MRATVMAAVAATALAVASTRAAGGDDSSTRISVFVSVLPQAYFVERVGGEDVSVQTLVGPGQSPHTFEPTPRQVADLSDARLYFTIGMPFEKVLVEKIRAAFPNVEIVDMRAGVTLRENAEDGDGREPDPHVWLSPLIAKMLAGNVAAALERVAPAERGRFEANLAAFDGDLDAVNAHIASALAPLRGRDFFVYHPAFGYFGDAYGLKQVAVEVEGKEPSAKQLADLIHRARAANVRVIFVQPQFSARNAEAVAEAIGGAVVPMDPLAGDYLANLEKMVTLIEKALTGEGGRAEKSSGK